MNSARGRVVRALTAILGTLAISGAAASTAGAQVATITGGETTLTPNIETVLNTWGSDRISSQVVPPARLNGLTFNIHFPITDGTIEPGSLTGLVNMAGGLRIVKFSPDFTAIETELETTNPRFVNGITMTGDVGALIPAPSFDLVNTQITAGDQGQVLFEADANLSPVTAIVLNTYFNTTVFVAGQNIGRIKSRIETQLYPRPGGGTPLKTPLAPAFKQCTAPNTTHAPPLALGSCDPATQESSLLTTSSVGRGAGSMGLTVVNGNLSTPEDEADVELSLAVSDVRKQSDGSDYTGFTALQTTLRVTDHAGGYAGNSSVTIKDFPFGLQVRCTTTPGPEGADCNFETTLDALLPNFVLEGKRAMFAARDVILKDAGADGRIPQQGCPPKCGSGDERAFLRGGLFAP